MSVSLGLRATGRAGIAKGPRKKVAGTKKAVATKPAKRRASR
jgi:hypothetical protein